MTLQKGKLMLVSTTNLEYFQRIDNCFPSPSSASSRIQLEMASSDTHQQDNEDNDNQPMD
ncbi:hypothetical protein F2Q69_00014671 [Brassica cretica]|uniref:Uncharacterized protein n=1 Tax=Brassica cretica TaxID=69181 RepID=A0A8S9QX18_BRACR|nr:hypothetical protein F2Q69_00014671 [Brassica cretica]